MAEFAGTDSPLHCYSSFEGRLRDKARQYRDLAAQCVLMATEESRQGHKAVLLEIAQRWLYLAERVEGREGNPNCTQ